MLVLLFDLLLLLLLLDIFDVGAENVSFVPFRFGFGFTNRFSQSPSNCSCVFTGD